MTKNYLDISIKDFRAIKSADIHLNGITVISGTNGSGKSTVSKLVYHAIKSINNYDALVVRQLRRSVIPFRDALLDILMSLSFESKSRVLGDWRALRSALTPRRISDISDLEHSVNSVCDRIKGYLDEDSAIIQPSKIERYRTILVRTLEESENYSVETALGRVRRRVQEIVDEAENRMVMRPASLVNEEMNQEFSTVVEGRVALNEYGEVLFGAQIDSVPVPHYIRQLFYIDTPFSLDIVDSDIEHWADLNMAVRTPDRIGHGEKLSRYISSEIIHGEADYVNNEQLQSSLRFKDRYGNEFGLDQCATGIKSFAIIQRLLKGGFLNKDTLLILDEPEAHLHPQWIIKYARLIVLTHKEIGVKFLISSHSTDMVSAIRYVAEKEGCMQGLEFYCARQAQDGTGRFNFRSVGHNIDPIFKSFNKSYSILDKYTMADYEEEADEM